MTECSLYFVPQKTSHPDTYCTAVTAYLICSECLFSLCLNRVVFAYTEQICHDFSTCLFILRMGLVTDNLISIKNPVYYLTFYCLFLLRGDIVHLLPQQHNSQIIARLKISSEHCVITTYFKKYFKELSHSVFYIVTHHTITITVIICLNRSF